VLPVKFIDGALLMCHKHLAGARIELRERGQTSSCTNSILPHAPEAFDGVEVMATVSRQEMEAELALVVGKGHVKLMRPMQPAPIDDHDDLFAGSAEDRHDLMDILAQLLGIKVRHDFIEDFGGAILDGANHAEQHAAGDPAPGAILQPRLAFAAFFAFDVVMAQGPGGQACPLGAAPPAQPGQGKAPQDRFVLVQ
jgi:hypothetical protein